MFIDKIWSRMILLFLFYVESLFFYFFHYASELQIEQNLMNGFIIKFSNL